MAKTKSFESALEELEIIVNSMEDGDIPLEKMIKSYENGMKLVNFCNKKLQDMEKRIEVLKINEIEHDSNKNENWSNFDKSSERDISAQSPTENSLESDDLPF